MPCTVLSFFLLERLRQGWEEESATDEVFASEVRMSGLLLSTEPAAATPRLEVCTVKA